MRLVIGNGKSLKLKRKKRKSSKGDPEFRKLYVELLIDAALDKTGSTDVLKLIEEVAAVRDKAHQLLVADRKRHGKTNDEDPKP